MAVFQPKVTSFEFVIVEGDNITADLLIWRRYRVPLAGTRLTEVFLDLNPQLAKLHRNSPYIPVGTQVRIPIDDDIMKGRPKPIKVITLFGEV